MFELKLPEIGEGVVEGEIVKWLISPGDTIKPEDPIVEVMTDKATVEVLSTEGGTVGDLTVKEGDIVPVGGTILTLDQGAGSSSGAPSAADEQDTQTEMKAVTPAPSAPKASAPKPTPAPKPAAPARSTAPAAAAAPGSDPRPGRGSAAPDKVLASPAARARARELGIDIESVVGTGPSGRVTPTDVDAARSLLRSGSAGGFGAGASSAPLTDSGEAVREPMRGLRRRIADAMVASKTTIPHFTYVDEVDMGAVQELRDSLKARAAQQGVKLSYLAFVGLAVRRAMADFPIVNAWHDDETGEVVRHPELHLGISVDTPRGLYVAVVRDAGAMGLFQLSAAIADVVDRVREGKAPSEELSGSTFTITSVGNIGGLFATPVINKPEVAILGMNRIVERPVAVDGQVVIRPMAYLSPSFDHRVVDGAVGARFTSRLKELLENPARIWLPEG